MIRNHAAWRLYCTRRIFHELDGLVQINHHAEIKQLLANLSRMNYLQLALSFVAIAVTFAKSPSPSSTPKPTSSPTPFRPGPVLKNEMASIEFSPELFPQHRGHAARNPIGPRHHCGTFGCGPGGSQNTCVLNWHPCSSSSRPCCSGWRCVWSRKAGFRRCENCTRKWWPCKGKASCCHGWRCVWSQKVKFHRCER